MWGTGRSICPIRILTVLTILGVIMALFGLFEKCLANDGMN